MPYTDKSKVFAKLLGGITQGYLTGYEMQRQRERERAEQAYREAILTGQMEGRAETARQFDIGQAFREKQFKSQEEYQKWLMKQPKHKPQPTGPGTPAWKNMGTELLQEGAALNLQGPYLLNYRDTIRSNPKVDKNKIYQAEFMRQQVDGLSNILMQGTYGANVAGMERTGLVTPGREFEETTVAPKWISGEELNQATGKKVVDPSVNMDHKEALEVLLRSNLLNTADPDQLKNQLDSIFGKILGRGEAPSTLIELIKEPGFQEVFKGTLRNVIPGLNR